MIKALIFDLGGVLQGLDWSPVVNSLLELHPNLDIFKYREAFYYRRKEHFDLYAVGKMDGAAFWSGVAQRLNMPPESIGKLSRSMELVYSFFDSELRELMLSLKPDYTLLALSNACPEIEKSVSENPAYHGLFDRLFFSHNMGCKKPSPEAYRFVCEATGLSGRECVFVDNDAANVQAAEAFGMHAVLYRGKEALSSDLSDRFSIDTRAAAKGDIGYTTGVFDLFHLGHLNLLRRAKSLCRRLIVGVTTDELCRRFKKVQPLVPYEERAAIVASVRYVDQVVPQRSMDKFEAWRELGFDIMFASQNPTGQWPEVERNFRSHFKDGEMPGIVYLPYTAGVSSTLRRRALGNGR